MTDCKIALLTSKQCIYSICIANPYYVFGMCSGFDFHTSSAVSTSINMLIRQKLYISENTYQYGRYYVIWLIIISPLLLNGVHKERSCMKTATVWLTINTFLWFLSITIVDYKNIFLALYK